MDKMATVGFEPTFHPLVQIPYLNHTLTKEEFILAYPKASLFLSVPNNLIQFLLLCLKQK